MASYKLIKRHLYKGYIIDYDNLGRLYIYNTSSPMSEDSDRLLVTGWHWRPDGRLMTDYQAAKVEINRLPWMAAH
jgi:hypothetical protein